MGNFVLFVSELAVPISVVFSFLVLAVMLYFRPIDIRRLTLDPVKVRAEATETRRDGEDENTISADESRQCDENGPADEWRSRQDSNL